MADIFLSYTSSDRARAEALRCWFEQAGWSVWIDRGIEIGEDWEERIERELGSARLVVVLWSAQARRSEWVQREAGLADKDGRLLQIHGTGLPLLPPFDTRQAVRMQSWSGEEGHSERLRLLEAVATRLGSKLSGELLTVRSDEDITAHDHDIAEALGLAFYYCARQIERVRLQRERGYGSTDDFKEIASSFSAMLALLRKDGDPSNDREGVLHTLLNDFLDQLLLLSPDPSAST